jgi:hypothetical protein
VKLFYLERFSHTYEGYPDSVPVGDSPHCSVHRHQGKYKFAHYPDNQEDIGHTLESPIIISITTTIITTMTTMTKMMTTMMMTITTTMTMLMTMMVTT